MGKNKLLIKGAQNGLNEIVVMGFEEREPTEKELEPMKELIEEPMVAGAVKMPPCIIVVALQINEFASQQIHSR